MIKIGNFDVTGNKSRKLINFKMIKIKNEK